MSPTHRPIRALPDHLVNQIAAGEVIERPASVIKELVENSLDAGATRVAIEIVDGGLERMVVTDDGSGMAPEDLPGALRRHWTSKIGTVDDLAALTSLGFRGEALASIASVAEIEIVTRRRGDAHAWQLRASPGQSPAAPVPCQGNAGTRITVSALFHQVPARRRFLKRGRTEFLHIQHLVRQFGFARPQVALSLAQDGSRGLRLAPAAPGVVGPRWRTLFGSAFAETARFVELGADGIVVRGWVGGPALAGNQSDLQFLALNGRCIRDRQLAHAVRLAFGEALPAGRFPAYALAIETAPDAVDVNVHPGKLEVRFADLRSVHDLLYVAVRRALEGGADAVAEEGAPLVGRASLALDLGSAEPQPAASHSPAGASGPAPAAAGWTAPAPTVSERRDTWPSPSPSPSSPAFAPARPAPPPAPATLFTAPLALVEDRYLLFRSGAAVALLDLRAAWAAVLRQRLAAPAAPSRPLLLPERLATADPLWRHVTPATLAAQGFEIDDLGAAGYVVRAAPRVLPELPWPAFFAQLGRLARDTQWPAVVALAAAASIDLGRAGQPARRQLEALALGAAAAGFDLAAHARPVDGDFLRRGLAGDG